MRRRLFWTGVVLALLLLAAVGYVLRAVETVVSTARGPAAGRRARRPARL